jgi:hypothetical protein
MRERIPTQKRSAVTFRRRREEFMPFVVIINNVTRRPKWSLGLGDTRNVTIHLRPDKLQKALRMKT